ncbi:hypothetical protein GFV12_04480 [Desulfurobacterium thermolithotrophum]|uniref:hypothetical protein n=1 Tax=Desulfurobacterium thermolithotrophum TaxID=64160 RepID=UPI0013D23A11|nr:hypothetical protein [Desulfurobacterium thermolithotrophum]
MLSEKIKKKISPYGKFTETFIIDEFSFDFFAFLETNLVHTTFFIKDYEIKSYFYIFGKRFHQLYLDDFKEILNISLSVSKKLLKTPEDHYLSTFIFILETEKTEEKVIETIQKTLISKSIWFGLKGSYRVGFVLSFKEKLFYPEEIKPFLSWLLD